MKKSLSIFELISSADTKTARVELIKYLKDQLAVFEVISDNTFDVAYNLAGLLATDYVRALNDNDPISSILGLAGELEIRPPNAEDLCREMVAEISNL